MKILTKLMLASAVMVTSGFAGGVSEFQEGGTLEAGTKLEFEDGAALTMNADKSLHVHGSVVGTGQINCQGTGQVIVYQGAYAGDSINANVIKGATSSTATTVHTYNPNIGGHIDSTVTVDPSDALIYEGPNLCEYASGLDNTNLVYVANADGSSVRCAGGTDAASEIVCELANTDASIDTLKPASLVVENKVKFSGNNAGFTSGTVTYGTLENPTETEIASQDAFFPVESVVEQGSKLSLTAAEGTTISKNLTVNGCNKWRLNDAEDEVLINENVGVLSVSGPVTVTNGACVKIKGKTEEAICEYPTNYPLVKSWPKGSFSGELTTLYKKYYSFESSNVSTEFPVTFDCEISYNEYSGETVVEYINQKNIGNTKILQTRATMVPNEYLTFMLLYAISVTGSVIDYPASYNIPLEDLPDKGEDGYREETVEITDELFSYKDGANGSVVRSAPYMLVSPNNLDLHGLMHSDNTEQYLYHLNSGNLMSLRYNYDNFMNLALYTNSNNWLAQISHYDIVLGLSGIEGNTDIGYFVPQLTGDNYDALNAAITEIDSANRSNPNENQWLTLEEYNTKYGTNFSW